MNPVECPKCGKRTIVRDGSVYLCLDLSCGFRRDITPPPPEPPKIPFDLIWGLLLGLVVFWSLQYLILPDQRTQPEPGVGFFPENRFMKPSSVDHKSLQNHEKKCASRTFSHGFGVF